MNAALETIGWWLVDFAWLATILLMAAAIMRVVVRQPAGRVALAWGTWLSVAAAAVLTAMPLWPRHEIRAALPRESAPPHALVMASELAPAPLPAEPNESLLPAEIVLMPHVESPVARTAWQLDWRHLPILAWLSSAVLALGWIGLGWWRMRSLVHCSHPAPTWVAAELARITRRGKRFPAVHTSERLATAVALGAVRPRIVLPLASAVESNAAAIRAALAHEWAHIRHGDLWLLALERLLVPMLAMHPLFWWLRRQARHDQELLADAAAAGDRPVEYAEALVAWAKRESPAPSGLAALAMWERPSNLSRRIQMILDPNRKPSIVRGRGWGLIAVALLIAMVAGLSQLTLGPSIAQDESRPKATIVLDPGVVETAANPQSLKQQVIVLEMTLLSFDPKALDEQNFNVKEVVEEAAGRQPARALGMLTAEVNAEQAKTLVGRLQALKGVQITSQPRVMTLSGQEATIQIGSEVPLVAVDETADGNRRELIEFKGVGSLLRVRPVLLPEDPGVIAIEVASEQTRLNRDKIEPSDATATQADPLFSTQRINFKATIEVGKTLVMLDPAEMKPASEEKGLAPAAEIKQREGLAIFLTPTKVEEQVVEIYPDPTLGRQAIAARQLAAAALQLAQARDGQAGGDDEAALAQQLREVRMVLEQLAREREQSRQENAALKAQLEQLKAELQKLSPAASGEEAIEPRSKPLPANSYQRNPLSVSPRPVPPAQSSARITRVYVFGGEKEAKDVGAKLGQLVSDGKLQLSILAENNNLIIAGTEAELAKVEPALASAGKLALESRTGTDFIAPPDAPYDAVRSGLEWLRKNGVSLDAQAAAARDLALQAQRQTERKLLELDLQAAELEVQAAQEDLQRIQELGNTVPAQELRNKQRAVDRAKIQLARIRVQLEAVESQPVDAARR